MYDDEAAFKVQQSHTSLGTSGWQDALNPKKQIMEAVKVIGMITHQWAMPRQRVRPTIVHQAMQRSPQPQVDTRTLEG